MTHNLVLLLLFVIWRLISTVGLTVEPAELLLQLGGRGQLILDPSGVSEAEPMAVVRPGSADDVAALVRSAFGSARSRFPVSARGHGHSTNGQALAPGGVVVEMSCGGGPPRPRPAYAPARDEHYVDVWGGSRQRYML
ncbi:hypothetical protein Cni_G25867 [Canna indica]|uniref:FAD linked oxidase N-terminal domain-containing protein n=1 Tax=Canna indica TaxID=4628 RepID=A0AAQ3L1X2_9LILI|nr:hypothetical protein Cni_G25867 [Canna indica]